MTVSASGQNPAEPSTCPNFSVQPLELGLTITLELTTEVGQSTGPEQARAPPEYPEVTFPHPEQLQSQNPYLTEATVPPGDLEVTRALRTVMETVLPTAEKKANVNLSAVSSAPAQTSRSRVLGQPSQPTWVPATVPHPPGTDALDDILRSVLS